MRHIISVYYEGGYSDIMGEKAEEAMNLAVEEVKGLPEYSVKGEVSISWTCNILIHIKWFVVGNHRCQA